MTHYVLGTTTGEQRRLQQQTEDFATQSESLIDQLDLRLGAKALDVGCGPRGILELLSRRVGPDGHVVGLEALPTHAQQARAMASELGLRNVEVIEGDIRSSDLPSDSFDVVHCRTVLNAIAAPQAVVEEMVRLTKPGGWVAAHEPDWLTLLCEPSHPSWDRLLALVMGIWKDDGADAFLGRRLQGMLRAAGLQDVAGSVHIDIRPKGHARRSVLQDFVRNLRDRILTERLVPEVELDEHLRSVDDHLSDPNTLVLGAMFFPAWGRKPADAS